jgi:hypothetical protein
MSTFDSSNYFLYGLVLIWNAWNVLFVLTVMLAVDFIYAGLAGVLSMEFDILSEKISKVEDAEELKKLIEIHQQLIEVTGELEEIFSPLLFMNIFATIEMLCSVLFLAVVSIVTLL